jgi:hypothetical protein
VTRARLVAGGVVLRDQTNKRWPGRDKRSDGWIGDKAHQARKSDHNPDSRGFVHAIDIDADLLGPNGGAAGRREAEELANQLRAFAASGRLGADRLKYIVWNNRIASGTYKDRFWTWRSGNWGHTQHIHVSFTTRGENNSIPFPLPIFNQQAGLWDGVVPPMDRIIAADKNPLIRNAAVWRLACRLHDLGHYRGRVLPRGVQGYPRKAVANLQQAVSGKSTGTYGPATHAAAFGL